MKLENQVEDNRIDIKRLRGEVNNISLTSGPPGPPGPPGTGIATPYPQYVMDACVAENGPRSLVTTDGFEGSQFVLENRYAAIFRIYIEQGKIINNASIFSGSNTWPWSPVAGDKLNFALYSPSGNLIQESINLAPFTVLAGTRIQSNFSPAYTIPSTGIYFVGFIFHIAADSPGTINNTFAIFAGRKDPGYRDISPPLAMIRRVDSQTWPAATSSFALWGSATFNLPYLRLD